MSHSISQNFNGRTLLKFAFPTIIMMVFMSMYTMVDGFFVSRFVGADALSAINIVYPLIGLVVGMGIMLGTGGSAVIARQLGLGQAQEARKNFTRILVFGLILGILFTIVSMVFLEPLLKLLGSSERLMGYCREYMIILLPFMAVQMLQTILGVLFVTAGKPNLGLGLTIMSGLANMILDYIFIAVLDWGIGGAALATAVGYSIMPVYAFFYFLKPRTELFLVKASFQGEVLWESCLNGSSEMVSNLAASVITWLMNLLMMHFAGEDGVAAVTVVLYTQFFFTAVFLGFSNGVAPVISYNYGSRNKKQLQTVFRICMKSMILCSFLMTGASILLAKPLVGLFLPGGTSASELTYQGYLLYSINYLFAGMNIFVSSLFTALSNGKISAMISMVRTFGFTVTGILLFSWLWEINGLWLAVPAAECATLILALYQVKKYKRVYEY